MAGFERDCQDALAKAREALGLAPYDPIVSAIVVDLLDYLGPAFEAQEIWQDTREKELLCTNAAFFHRAMAQYYPRSWAYFDEACPSEAATLPRN